MKWKKTTLNQIKVNNSFYIIQSFICKKILNKTTQQFISSHYSLALFQINTIIHVSSILYINHDMNQNELDAMRFSIFSCIHKNFKAATSKKKLLLPKVKNHRFSPFNIVNMSLKSLVVNSTKIYYSILVQGTCYSHLI